MTTKHEREVAEAYARGRAAAQNENDKSIREAGLTTSFNLNVIVTTRNEKLINQQYVQGQIIDVLRDARAEGRIVRFQISATQVITGAGE